MKFDSLRDRVRDLESRIHSGDVPSLDDAGNRVWIDAGANVVSLLRDLLQSEQHRALCLAGMRPAYDNVRGGESDDADARIAILTDAEKVAADIGPMRITEYPEDLQEKIKLWSRAELDEKACGLYRMIHDMCKHIMEVQ